MSTAVASGSASAAFDPTKLNGSYCIAGEGHVAVWNAQFAVFADMGQLDGVEASTMAFASPTDLWLVDGTGKITRGSMAAAGPPPTPPVWTPLEQLGSVKMVAFQGSTLYAVDEEGHVNQWASYGWQPALMNSKTSDPWVVNMIAYDGKTWWCVAYEAGCAYGETTAGTRVGKWDTTYNQWTSYGNLDRVQLNMIAFDANSNLWGVSSDGKMVGYWDPTNEVWIEAPAGVVPDGTKWLVFAPASH